MEEVVIGFHSRFFIQAIEKLLSFHFMECVFLGIPCIYRSTDSWDFDFSRFEVFCLCFEPLCDCAEPLKDTCCLRLQLFPWDLKVSEMVLRKFDIQRIPTRRNLNDRWIGWIPTGALRVRRRHSLAWPHTLRGDYVSIKKNLPAKDFSESFFSPKEIATDIGIYYGICRSKTPRLYTRTRTRIPIPRTSSLPSYNSPPPPFSTTPKNCQRTIPFLASSHEPQCSSLQNTDRITAPRARGSSHEIDGYVPLLTSPKL